VDGKNWPSLEKKEWPPEAGAWRVEVSPATPSKADLFLHVLQTGEAEIAKPEAVVLTRPGNMVGLVIRAQGREYMVAFAPGKATCQLRVVEGGKTVVEEELK
jgi:hypothetical protein